MRFEAGQGWQYLTAARQRSGSTNLDIADHDPGDPKPVTDNLLDRWDHSLILGLRQSGAVRPCSCMHNHMVIIALMARDMDLFDTCLQRA